MTGSGKFDEGILGDYGMIRNAPHLVLERRHGDRPLPSEGTSLLQATRSLDSFTEPDGYLDHW